MKATHKQIIGALFTIAISLVAYIYVTDVNTTRADIADLKTALQEERENRLRLEFEIDKLRVELKAKQK